jgi:hypothetical protein
MTEPFGGASDAGQRERRLTVAQVRTHAEGAADVMFHETARIYQLPRTAPDYEGALRRLRTAAAARKPVRVRFLVPNGDVIESVRTED